MTQLHEIVQSIRHKVEDTIQLIRTRTNDLSTSDGDYTQGDSQESSSYSKLHRLRQIAVNSLGSSCSPEARSPDEGSRTAKAVDSFMGTLFGDCYGSDHTGTNHCPGPMSSFSEKEFVMKMQNRHDFSNTSSTKRKSRSKNNDDGTPIIRSQGLPVRTINPVSSSDECQYAQYYNDDHAKAAKAVIQAREREERERGIYRKRMEHIKAEAEADSHRLRSEIIQDDMNNHSKLSSLTEKKQFTHRDFTHLERNDTIHHPPLPRKAQHRENIKVAGDPYRLYEVTHSFSNQQGDDKSYNYDDGISALSAHTLEEMAKENVYLLRRNQSMTPEEQGFDIVAGSTTSRSPTQNNSSFCPPSPVIADKSSSFEADSYHKSLEKASNDGEDDDESEYGDLVRTLYPVQHNNSSDSRHTHSSSHSSDSDLYYKEEKQYWTQVVEGEHHLSELDIAKINAGNINAQKALNSGVTHINNASSHMKRKSRRSRSMKLFHRRSGYIECEEDIDSSRSLDSDESNQI